MRRVLSLLVVSAFLVACEAIVGTDFGSYSDKCSPLNDRCPKANPCVFDYTRNQFACAPRSGTKGQDGSCDTDTDCAPGFSCNKAATNNFSHCMIYCVSAAGCSEGTCYTIDPAQPLPAGGNAGACGPLDKPCDPLSTTAMDCGSGLRCTMWDTDYTVCRSQDESRAVGQPCDTVSQCQAGANCVTNAQNQGMCTRLCDLDNASCPGTTKCQQYSPPRKLGMKRIGLCL